jgi:AraC-like DNA-binding protein
MHLEWITLASRPEPCFFRSAQVEYYMASWILQGKAIKRMGKQTLEIHPGEWVFQQPGTISTRYTAGTRYYQIAFTLRWDKNNPLLHPPSDTLWKTGPLPQLEAQTVHLHQCVLNELQTDDKYTYQMRNHLTDMHGFLRIHHQFQEWLIHWEAASRAHHIHWRQVAPNEDKIAMAAHFMHEHPLHSSIHVEEMARNLGLSARHLTNLFRQRYGMAPKQYRMHLKLKEAIRLLQSTQCEMKEIAHQLGCSQVWLATWLKKQTGSTPTEIRRRDGR